MSEKTVSDFKKGMRVRYTPYTRPAHPDRFGDGVVSSTNDEWVFVKYDNSIPVMEGEHHTAVATNPKTLTILEEEL